jgi:hypothetical protein
VPEDGGVTHELVSDLHPQGMGAAAEIRWNVCATDISLSVVDRPGPGGWIRAQPTVQVEGGRFSIAEARRLRQALDDLLSRVGAA